jgi:hypothetical protein
MASHDASAHEREELDVRFAACRADASDASRAHEVLHVLRVALAELEEETSPHLADAAFVEQGRQCERTLTRERRETAAANGRLRAMNRDLVRGERRLVQLLREASMSGERAKLP